tara:strand:+ start:109 stop:327 length:219 start_codon:yes stop_codon:yes gene_type:complete
MIKNIKELNNYKNVEGLYCYNNKLNILIDIDKIEYKNVDCIDIVYLIDNEIFFCNEMNFYKNIKYINNIMNY